MDIQDQLKNLFPDHVPTEAEEKQDNSSNLWLQDDPIICKYEKRKAKRQTYYYFRRLYRSHRRF